MGKDIGLNRREVLGPVSRSLCRIVPRLAQCGCRNELARVRREVFGDLLVYPKDDTTGCTRQACELRDSFPRFTKADAVILGISPDSVKSHAKFRQKYALPFTLLADTDHAVCDAYGVWKEKRLYGHKYMGVERSTFVIDPKGKLVRAMLKVKPEGHADAVAAALADLA